MDNRNVKEVARHNRRAKDAKNISMNVKDANKIPMAGKNARIPALTSRTPTRSPWLATTPRIPA